MVSFCNSLLLKYLRNGPNVVVGGDFKFSLGMSKTWGPQAQVDPLVDLFSSKLMDSKMIDIILSNISQRGGTSTQA